VTGDGAAYGAVMPQSVTLGSHGEDVRRLQEALVAQGYYVGTVDGVFGNKTMAAVGYYQSVCGLEIDGVAGPHVYDYLGVADVNDSVHIELPATDVINGPGHYTVHVMGNVTKHGARVLAWFRGANGDHNTEAVTVDLVPNQHVQADLPIPQDVVQAGGEYHVVVYCMDGANSIGEQTGVVHVHHEAGHAGSGAAQPAGSPHS